MELIGTYTAYASGADKTGATVRLSFKPPFDKRTIVKDGAGWKVIPGYGRKCSTKLGISETGIAAGQRVEVYKDGEGLYLIETDKKDA